MKQEKAKAKKRKRRHPRYDHLYGKYLNYYYNVVPGGYYKHSTKLRGLAKSSLINSNLHRPNKRCVLQLANISLRSREEVAKGTSYVTAYMCPGWSVNNSNPNPTPSNIHYYRSSRGPLQPQPLMPGGGTTASEAPRTGEGTSINSPKAEGVEGEVDEGATTDAPLLPTDPQNRESRFTAPSTHFTLNQTDNNFVVTLNPAPPGSLTRQILVSEGSGGPPSTVWTMYPYTELNKTELQQPLSTFPVNGQQGGTPHNREHRERNVSVNNSHPKNKIQIKTHSETRKTLLALLKPLS